MKLANMMKASIFALLLASSMMIFIHSDAKAVGAVTNLIQPSAATDNISLKWDATLGATSYKVQFSTNNVDWVDKQASYSPSANIYYLSPGKSYYVRVLAYKSGDANTEVLVAQSAVILAVTSPTIVQNIKQIAASANSITLTWGASSGASGYFIYNQTPGQTPVFLSESKTNRITINRLTSSTKYQILIKPYRTGTVATAWGDYSGYSDCFAKTLTFISGSPYIDNQAGLYIRPTWNEALNADGYQLLISNYKNRIISSYYSTTNYYDIKAKTGMFCKYQVRPYILVNGTKLFGSWTPSKLYGITSKSSAVFKGSKIKFSWNKILGSTKYAIYISDNETTNFKKVKTLSNKYTSLTISKYGTKSFKKGATYFIRLVALGKIGKLSETSPLYTTVSCYRYK